MRSPATSGLQKSHNRVHLGSRSGQDFLIIVQPSRNVLGEHAKTTEDSKPKLNKGVKPEGIYNLTRNDVISICVSLKNY